MDNQNESAIPLDAIAKGRPLDDVLTAYMNAFEASKNAVASMSSSDDELYADAMTGAVYRIYLLGVEDGMKGETK